jgi:hypothetical protein
VLRPHIEDHCLGWASGSFNRGHDSLVCFSDPTPELYLTAF